MRLNPFHYICYLCCLGGFNNQPVAIHPVFVTMYAHQCLNLGNAGAWFLMVTDLYMKAEPITNGGQMELSSRNFSSSFTSTNDLNLSPSRKRTITKGKTINPHEDLEECHSATASNMVSQSTVSCQTRSNEFYCLNNNEEGIAYYPSLDFSLLIWVV